MRSEIRTVAMNRGYSLGGCPGGSCAGRVSTSPNRMFVVVRQSSTRDRRTGNLSPLVPNHFFKLRERSFEGSLYARQRSYWPFLRVKISRVELAQLKPQLHPGGGASDQLVENPDVKISVGPGGYHGQLQQRRRTSW